MKIRILSFILLAGVIATSAQTNVLHQRFDDETTVLLRELYRTLSHTNRFLLKLDDSTQDLLRQIAQVGSRSAFGAQTSVLSIRPDDETRRTIREATEDRWIKKDAALSTVVGGLLAALAGFGAGWFSHTLQAKHEKTREKEDRIIKLYEDRYADSLFSGETRLSRWLAVENPTIKDLTEYERHEEQRYTDIMRLLHFFGRVAMLVDKNEIDRQLAQKFFSESAEYWMVNLFRRLVKVSDPKKHSFLRERVTLIETQLVNKPALV